MGGLSVSRLIRVNTVISASPVAVRGFGTLLAMGDSDVINGLERFRQYTNLEDVAADFGTTAPEYFAAQLFYSQSPKPMNFFVGRWLRTETSAILRGASLSTTEQLIATWQAITSGGFKITVDEGTEEEVLSLNFSGAANLNAVAAIINAAITGASCIWNGSQFIITSDSTGASSKLSYLTAPDTGTDISVVMKMTLATGFAPIDGYDAETALEAVTAMAELSNDWYGVMFAAATMPVNDSILAVAGYIEALTVKRVFGVVETDSRAKDATYNQDLGTLLKALGYKRTCAQYSQNKYAIASLFGRAFSVNFNGNRSTITLMYKQEPSVVAETITNTEANTLQAKRLNVFVNYDNDTAIIQYGVMSGDAYFDEIHGTDWLENRVQTDVYNLFYTSTTKVPQTPRGLNRVQTAISAGFEQAITNGLIGEGVWNGDDFGQLKSGDYLPTGYYIYVQPLDQQSQADRVARKCPPFTIAAKLAGAFHEADILINVNQ